ncbi:hypothetical protein ENBRE01_2892, partial [Enteropsectra breve]
NIELYEFDAISENANLTDLQKLQYIEDSVYNQDKTHWLLKIAAESAKNKALVSFYNTARALCISENSRDASQDLLLDNLSKQFNFFIACTHKNIPFDDKVLYLKNFIKDCTEIPYYPFIIDLINIIATSNLSTEELERYFVDICSAVPIEYAEKYSVLFYYMILGYFKMTKDSEKNLKFIRSWMLSKYSFILVGFKHIAQINGEEAEYYPLANDIYSVFTDALHDPRLIDNIISYKALDFTITGLSYYLREKACSYELFIINLVQNYYKKLKEENSSETYHEIFVNRHYADVSRYSYPIYQNIITQTSGEIESTDFNESNGEENHESLPAFIYDAVLKMVYTLDITPNNGITNTITEIATFFSALNKCEKNYVHYLRETFKIKSSAIDVANTSITECLMQGDYPSAILLFKNLPSSSATQAAIELFKSKNKLTKLIEGIQKFEFVSWENETPIYNMVKEHDPTSVEALLERMSMQPSCFFAVPSEEVDQIIEAYYNHYGNYYHIGSLAFVCKNTELLISFKDELECILTSWDFALNLDKFYDGVFSPEGTTAISDLPFFRMFYHELFAWLDHYIAGENVALKVSRMLMVAKLAVRDVTERMEVDDTESTSHREKCSESISALEKNILKAVAGTTVGYQALCAFQFYMSATYKKYLEKDVLPRIVAIEGADSVDLLQAREFRVLYRKLLKKIEGLNTEQGLAGCSEKEMLKFLEVLFVLGEIEACGALSAIKRKSEIKGVVTDIKYYTDNIPVMPLSVCKLILESL